MKHLLFIIVAASFLTSCENQTTAIEASTEIKEMKTGLRHVVLFKFKEDVTAETIKEVEEAFSALPGKIPEIKEFEWSNNNVSPEGFGQGFTHCYILTFEDENGRNIYLPHPDHKAFGELVGPALADGGVLVYDYSF